MGYDMGRYCTLVYPAFVETTHVCIFAFDERVRVRGLAGGGGMVSSEVQSIVQLRTVQHLVGDYVWGMRKKVHHVSIAANQIT